MTTCLKFTRSLPGPKPTFAMHRVNCRQALVCWTILILTGLAGCTSTSPGLLGLVHRVDEGEQNRVGNNNVAIDGEYEITKRPVVISPLRLRPGELLETRKLRDPEARLTKSRLFSDGVSSPGTPPRVVVKPPELEELSDTRHP